MRSFLAGLVLFVSLLTGTAALGAYTANRTVLEPREIGRVVTYALADPALRSRVLRKVIPGYDALPSVLQAGVSPIADTSAVRRGTRRLRLSADGTVSLAPLQASLVKALRSSGLTPVATIVAGVHSPTLDVPQQYIRTYVKVRDGSHRTALVGAAITALLLVLALVVSPDRRRSVRTIGVIAVLASLVVGVGAWLLPSVVRAASSDPLVDAVAGTLRDQRHDVVSLLLPFVVAGVVLVVGAVVAGFAGRSSLRSES